MLGLVSELSFYASKDDAERCGRGDRAWMQGQPCQALKFLYVQVAKAVCKARM